ncbi:cyclopropane-fatty-acyl-phospholipid synthase family protein, partial [Mycobacterium sp.]|uniref:cyclopropane-fatty-acyl-phospholipid synthase family protein n=1 Tax=Mycobacterium sp. TaxID=1785 RepID=UPI0031CF25F4
MPTATYEGASQAAIQQHYDLGNDFYALWLDATMSYSCGKWSTEDDTLERAQKSKIDYLASGAGATQARRVLDIGCGWGAMLTRLVQDHGVQHGVGLTLSDAQASRARQPDCEVRVENWIDHKPDTRYDAIVSVGAFEHFADMGMNREARISAYREFFARCAEWLPPGGGLSLETTVKGNNTKMSRTTVRDLLFIIDRIFPESEVPWLSEIVEASERLFETTSVLNRPDDYARTCLHWQRRLSAAQDRAQALTSADTVRDYSRYLNASVDAFANRHLGLAWLTFERI